MGVLGKLSCDLVQGYYFARPQSAERIAELLRRHKVGALASSTQSDETSGGKGADGPVSRTGANVETPRSEAKPRNRANSGRSRNGAS